MNNSIYQIVELIIINILGILCVSFIIILFSKYKEKHTTKIKTSIITSVLGYIFCLVVIYDISLFYRNNYQGNFELSTLVKLIVCASSIFLPIFFAGSYIQLTYIDKFQQIATSIGHNKEKEINNK